MKVLGTIAVVVVLLGGLILGGSYFAWKRWGGSNLEEENEALRSELVKGRVVATDTIQADPEVYEAYTKREDILVVVEYYSDT